MKNQIAKILPRGEWEKVLIREANEPLVEVKETARLKVGLTGKNYRLSFFVRKTIADKLFKVSENLPNGINLALYRRIQESKISAKILG